MLSVTKTPSCVASCSRLVSTTGGARRLRVMQVRIYSSSSVCGGSPIICTKVHTVSKKCIHSSTASKQSTIATSMDFVHSAQAPSARSILLNENSSTSQPSWQALRTLFIASAIPMVGFGFMDNLVMIQAGQYIDSTIGVSLGLATMTAAAAGQVVSDVSGVVFGGTLERFLTRMSLIKSPALTVAQRQTALCRNVSMAGAVVGVVIGCALGATTLLLVDLEARDRIERASQLRDVVSDMMNTTTATAGDEHHGVALAATSCTVHLMSAKDFDTAKLDNADFKGDSGLCRTVLRAADASLADSVKQCARDKQVVMDDSDRVLYAPIVYRTNGQVLAVMEIRKDDDDSEGFSEPDVRTAAVMAQHVGIFMDRLVD